VATATCTRSPSTVVVNPPRRSAFRRTLCNSVRCQDRTLRTLGGARLDKKPERDIESSEEISLHRRTDFPRWRKCSLRLVRPWIFPGWKRSSTDSWLISIRRNSRFRCNPSMRVTTVNSVAVNEISSLPSSSKAIKATNLPTNVATSTNARKEKPTSEGFNATFAPVPITADASATNAATPHGRIKKTSTSQSQIELRGTNLTRASPDRSSTNILADISLLAQRFRGCPFRLKPILPT